MICIGTGNNSAGYWGEPLCDLPMQTLVNLMEHLNDTSDQFEWIYLTGDLPAHNVWDQTKSGQVSILKKIISLFDEYLPNKPLFYAIGNHESDPVNRYIMLSQCFVLLCILLVILQLLSLIIQCHGCMMLLLTCFRNG